MKRSILRPTKFGLVINLTTARTIKCLISHGVKPGAVAGAALLEEVHSDTSGAIFGRGSGLAEVLLRFQ
jgi:hypothetical protein